MNIETHRTIIDLTSDHATLAAPSPLNTADTAEPPPSVPFLQVTDTINASNLTEEQLIEQLNLYPYITTLNLSNNTHIKKLPEFLPSLTSINLDNCSNLLDITSLSKCPSLKSLSLNHTPITELPPLSTSLEWLGANGCAYLTNISSLNNCWNLKSLGLDGSAITVVPYTSSLEEIFVSNCPYLVNINSICSCINLKAFACYNSPNVKILIIDSCISPVLPQLPNSLETIQMSNCNNVDISSITQCSNLQQLLLYNVSIAALPKLPSSLRTIKMQFCRPLSDIAALQYCTSLQTLHLEEIAATTLPAMSSELQSLTITNCSRLKNIETLQTCKQLKEVTLTLVPVQTIPAITPFPSKMLLNNCYDLATIKSLSSATFSQLYLKSCPKLPYVTYFNDSTLTELPSINNKVIAIVLKNCPNLTNVKSLNNAKNLRTLKCHNIAISTIPQLSSNLTHVSILDCPKLTNINAFESNNSLKAIDIMNAKIRSLPLLPRTIEHVKLQNCPELSDVSTLSSCTLLKTIIFSKVPQLKSINLSNNPNLTTLPELPENLESLYVNNCPNLVNVQSLSKCKHLKIISLEYSAITTLPPLAETIEEVRLSGCEKLTDITVLKKCPALQQIYLEDTVHIKELDFSGFKHLKQMLYFPKNVEKINFFSCTKLTAIGTLEACTSLRYLNIDETAIETLPQLPPSITWLGASRCRQLQNISSISQCMQLQTVGFEESAITTLPPLADTLQEIHLRGCRKLSLASLLQLQNKPKLKTVALEGTFDELILRAFKNIAKMTQIEIGQYILHYSPTTFDKNILIAVGIPEQHLTSISDIALLKTYLASKQFLELTQVSFVTKAILLLQSSQLSLLFDYCKNYTISERITHFREVCKIGGKGAEEAMATHLFTETGLSARHYAYQFQIDRTPDIKPAPQNKRLTETVETVLLYISPSWPDTQVILDDRTTRSKTVLLEKIRTCMHALEGNRIVDGYDHAFASDNQIMFKNIYGNIFYLLCEKISEIQSLNALDKKRITAERDMRSFVQQLGTTLFHCGDRIKTDSIRYYNKYIGNCTNSIDQIQNQKIEESIHLELLSLRRRLFDSAYFSMDTDEHDAATQRSLTDHFNIPFGLNLPRYNASDIWTARYAMQQKITELPIYFNGLYTFERIVEHLNSAFLTTKEVNHVITHPWYTKIQEFLTSNHPEITDWNTIFNLDAENYTFKGLHRKGMEILLSDTGII